MQWTTVKNNDVNIIAIRNTLRKGTSNSLRRRRIITLLAAIGITDFCIISLYQMGFIKKLPDFPGKIFDSNQVNASEDAYQMGLPDGPVSTGVYALNMILASYRGDAKSGRPKFADIALAGSVFANAAGAAYYLKNMITRQGKVCPYCITGAVVNFAMVPFAAANLKDIFLEGRQRS